MTKRVAVFEVWQSKSYWLHRWYFHLKAANGEIVFPSEPYPTRAHALRAIKMIQRLSGKAKVVTGKPR